MARSRSLLALPLALALGACPAPPPAAPPIVTAPVPVVYSCAQQKQAAAELAMLPAGSVIGIMIGDYMADRAQDRRALGLPDPVPCPGGAAS